MSDVTRERIEAGINHQRTNPGDWVYSPYFIRKMLASADFDISEYEVQLPELDIAHAKGQLRIAIDHQNSHLDDTLWNPSFIRYFIEHARSLGIDVSLYEKELHEIKKKIAKEKMKQRRARKQKKNFERST